MPYVTLADEIAAMRSGHGSRRDELRERLAGIDRKVTAARNAERARLSQFQYMAQRGDTRRSAAQWASEIEQSTERLARLDRQIATLMARSEPAPVAVAPAALPDPIMVAEARSALRGRLWLASSLLGGLPLAPEPVRRVQAAITTALRKL